MGFGPIAVDFVGFRLQGLINELAYGISTGIVWSAIKQDILSSINLFVDTAPPVFIGGHFVVNHSSTTSSTNGSTFNPFTYYSGSTVTCTDTPTAGTQKGQTIQIPLDWTNFEFRDTLPSGATSAVSSTTRASEHERSPTLVTREVKKMYTFCPNHSRN